MRHICELYYRCPGCGEKDAVLATVEGQHVDIYNDCSSDCGLTTEEEMDLYEMALIDASDVYVSRAEALRDEFDFSDDTGSLE